MSSRRKIGVAIVAVIAVLLAATMVFDNFNRNKQPVAGNYSTGSAQAPSVVTTATPAPGAETDGTAGEESSPNAPPSKGSTVNAHDRSGAVLAAANAVQAVSTAQLLPPQQMEEAIRENVVPAQVPLYVTAFIKAGPATVTSPTWGYADTQDANGARRTALENALAQAQYNVTTTKYKSVNYTNTKAVISLYTKTTWLGAKELVNEQNQYYRQLYTDYNIQVTTMQWSHGRWLLVKTDDPPAGQAPPPTRTRLTPHQDAQRFAPYLKEFHAISSIK